MIKKNRESEVLRLDQFDLTIQVSAIVYGVMGLENIFWFFSRLFLGSWGVNERLLLDLFLGTMFVVVSMFLFYQYRRKEYKYVLWPYALSAVLCLIVQLAVFFPLMKDVPPEVSNLHGSLWSIFFMHNSWISVGLLLYLLIKHPKSVFKNRSQNHSTPL